MHATRDKPAHSSRLWWGGLVAGGGMLICLAIWFADAVSEAREAARRSQCRGHFCNLKIALLNYHDTYDSFPPAYVNGPDGRRWHSWRTLLLPYVDQQDVYERYRFDEPWDSPHNQALAAPTRFNWLQCPTSDGYSTTSFANYFAVVGDRTLFPGTDSVSLDDMAHPEEVILIVEAEGLNIHWMEPRDLDLEEFVLRHSAAGREITAGRGVNSAHPVGTYVIDAGRGCNARLLNTDQSTSELRRQLTFEQDHQSVPPD